MAVPEYLVVRPVFLQADRAAGPALHQAGAIVRYSWRSDAIMRASSKSFLASTPLALANCRGEVRLLGSVHHRLRLLAFPMRTIVLGTHSTPMARPQATTP
jgi:hypothetical protein